MRQSQCNPNINDAADLVLTFTDLGEDNYWVEYSNTADARSPSVTRVGTNGFIVGGETTSVNSFNSSINSYDGIVNKLFTQELQNIADRDPLHDLTVQVSLGSLIITKTS